MLSLLTDRLIPVRSLRTSGSLYLSLPEVFMWLPDAAGDGVRSFPGLSAHQAPAWYQFLVQVGALARGQSGGGELNGAEDWEQGLRALAPGVSDSAWALVTEPDQPALLQPPTARLDEFKPGAQTPDGLGPLFRGKNHDVKRARQTSAEPHHWLYALVHLQTHDGFAGRGNQGVARMNGGFSSRVLVDRRPSPMWGPRVGRGIRMLLDRRDEILEGPWQYRRMGGLSLLWLESWDEDQSLHLARLDPYFVEVCRRVRLTSCNGTIRLWKRPSHSPRLDAKALNGNLGDPWVPVKLAGKGKGPAALTVSAGGFDYRLCRRILFPTGEFMPAPALRELDDEQGRDTEIHLAALVRGQGRTEGFYERVIECPASVHAVFETPDDDDEEDERVDLAQVSEDMVAWAGEVRRVLRRALLVYLQGPERPDFQRPDARPLLDRFDRAVDIRFFSSLFKAVEGIEAAQEDWHEYLKQEAVRVAGQGWRELSPPSMRREKAHAASERVLWGGLRKSLPLAFQDDMAEEESA